MSFFFVEQERCVAGETIELTGSVARRLLNVRRYKVGEEIEIQDLSKSRFVARVAKVETRKLILEITRETQKPKLPNRKVSIVCAYISENMLDVVLQKCTELGAENVLIFRADHSPHAPKIERLSHKINRWQAIFVSACEQSGRAEAPKLFFFDSLDLALQQCAVYKDATIIYLEQNATGKISQSNHAICVCVGPEGGWSEREINLFKERGIENATLGTYTLRTETAAIAAMAVANGE